MVRAPSRLLLLALASTGSPVSAADLRNACLNETRLFCSGAGGAHLAACLGALDEVTSPCRAALRELESRASGAAAERGTQARREARLSWVKGAVYVQSAGGAEGRFHLAAAGLSLSAGDLVRTGTDGSTEIALDGHSLILLSPNTDFLLKSLKRGDTDLLLGIGRLLAKLRALLPGERLVFRTPSCVAAIRGTELALEDGGPGEATRVAVFDEGQVAVTPIGVQAETLLGPNQEIEARAGSASTAPVPLARLASARPQMEAIRAHLDGLKAVWVPRPPAERDEQRASHFSRGSIPAKSLDLGRKQRALSYPPPAERLPRPGAPASGSPAGRAPASPRNPGGPRPEPGFPAEGDRPRRELGPGPGPERKPPDANPGPERPHEPPGEPAPRRDGGRRR